MAKSHPPFASSEFVKRWLAEIQSTPGEDEPTQIKHPQQFKRHRSLRLCQNPDPGVHMTPHKRRKGASSRRITSPTRRKAQSINRKIEIEDEEERQTSRSGWSDLPADIFDRDHAPSSSRLKQAAPQDPTEKYARRPRCKTKVDRYEYKGDVIRTSPAKPALKSRHKRSRRSKTGDMLNQEFKAPNVEQERLTLKASAGPGIFGKGKASALVQTAGLPDLTFSEMTFLSKKRQPDLAQPEKQKPSNASKNKDRSKEISRFFAKAQSDVARPRRMSSEVSQCQYTMGPAESPAISSPAKLASRTELSLVAEILSSPGIHSKQARRVPRQTDHNAAENVKESYQHQTAEALPADPVSKPVPTARTSYSWSVPPSRPGYMKQPMDRSASAEQMPPQSAQQSRPNPARESSITNSSLDRYTKHLLLENDGMRREGDRAPLGPAVLSLDDLKGLARIAEIERRHIGLPGINSRPEINLEPDFSSIATGASAAYCVQPEFGLGKHSAMWQLPVGNVTTKVPNQALPAKLGALPPWPLYPRHDEQSQARPRITTPRVGSRGGVHLMHHDSSQLDHERHHNNPSHIPGDHFGSSQLYTHQERQFYQTLQHHSRVPTPFDIIPELGIGANEEGDDQSVDNEQSHIYRNFVQQPFGPAMSMLPTVGVLGLEDYTSLDVEANSNIPELDGLLDREYMEEQREICGQGSGVQFSNYHDGNAGMGLGNSFQDSAEQHLLGNRGNEVSARNRDSALQSFEGPEEGFQGFSRPQILY